MRLLRPATPQVASLDTTYQPSSGDDMTAALPHTWNAEWIEPTEAEDTPTAHRPAYHLANEFSLETAPLSAVLYATAHGVYEAFINGERVGDIELTPGFNSYRSRLQVHAFDVSSLVQEGPNAIGALVSDGWWRGQHGAIREVDAYGT